MHEQDCGGAIREHVVDEANEEERSSLLDGVSGGPTIAVPEHTYEELEVIERNEDEIREHSRLKSPYERFPVMICQVARKEDVVAGSKEHGKHGRKNVAEQQKNGTMALLPRDSLGIARFTRCEVLLQRFDLFVAMNAAVVDVVPRQILFISIPCWIILRLMVVVGSSAIHR